MTNSIDNAVLGRLGLSQRAAEPSSDRLGQEDFMRLMVTQLRNQDPFKPMESGDFLGQLAQFGTVSGIEGMQSALESLSQSFNSNQALQAAGLVDRDVLVPAREGWLPPEGRVRGAVDVPAGAANVAVGVYDLSGRLVASVPVEDRGQATAAFEWDGSLADGGRAPPGFYELRATAQIGQDAEALDVLVAGRVESVSVGGNDRSVSLTVTGLGVVDFDTVRSIG